MTETVTRRIKGQAGDPQFLTVYQRSVAEISRLENLYKLPKARQSDSAISVEIRGSIDLSKLSPEKLLQAKQVLARLQDALKTDSQISQVVDVPVLEPPTDDGGSVTSGSG